MDKVNLSRATLRFSEN